MRRLVLNLCFSILAPLLASCSEMPWDGPSEDSLRLAERVTGAWMQDSIEWSVGTDTSEALAWTSSLLSLVLHRDGALSLQTRGIYLLGRDSIAFTRAPDRVGYAGRWWTIDSSTAAVEYRLTYSDLRAPGEALPGPVQHDTLRLVGEKLDAVHYRHREAPVRAFRLQRPARLARESLRAITWRDSLARRRHL
jgi:hypothetical protein